MSHLFTTDKIDNFDRPQTLTTTPGGEFGWTIADTSSAGAPTYATQSGRGMKLTLAADSEAENVCMHQNDVLPYTLAELQLVEFVAKVSGIDAVTTLVMGVGSGRNDTPDSVATNAWFRMQGSASLTAVVVETDDGATDDDDNATGITLGSTYKKFGIDFTQGLSDVRFYIDGQRVGGSFSMAAAAGSQGVQLIFQLQKASGTGVPSVTIGRVRVRSRLSY